ncbi:ubiquinone biosynthesis protein UbiD [Thermohalobacter berrensis]|uniref:Ubiquinone biosynthesis protein UbiD n=2 Tax=Thermohalobacter berrensis TaxID=99594 RepID=A0A419T2I2_9FIRM|nr:ubiquinone biosynthesis protein UbiD [Thermohalobacter berrensis]
MLRASLKRLKEKNDLLICEKEVDPKYELGAVLKYFQNTRPILFNRIKGSNIPIIGGMFGNRKLYYEMIDTTHEERIHAFINAIANPMEPKVIPNGPIKENIIRRNIDLPRMFPIPTFHDEDSAPFITSGIVAFKDPDTGNVYTAVRRLQVNGGNNINVLIASPMMTELFEKFEAQNKPLEIAVILGYDYEFLLASQVSSELYGVDKYKIDSALRGEPLELVKCETIDLEVPAYAEIVLEGVMVPNKRIEEGPFGELMGYYGGKAPHPVMEVKAVLHRNNPILQVAFPCREEHLANGLMREVELYSALDKQVDVNDVNVTVGGGYRFHGVASINKKTEGDGKTAILAALGSNKDLKHVVIVDNDVDIFDSKEVEGIIATRVQGSKDIVIIEGGIGSGLDPSHFLRGVTDKVGIDATKPLGEDGKRFEKAKMPGYENINIKEYFPSI